jgi:hypothetical protein
MRREANEREREIWFAVYSIKRFLVKVPDITNVIIFPSGFYRLVLLIFDSIFRCFASDIFDSVYPVENPFKMRHKFAIRGNVHLGYKIKPHLDKTGEYYELNLIFMGLKKALPMLFDKANVQVAQE